MSLDAFALIFPEPSIVMSLPLEMFGYGIGMNGAGGPGVLPTQGKLALSADPEGSVNARLLTNTVADTMTSQVVTAKPA